MERQSVSSPLAVLLVLAKVFTLKSDKILGLWGRSWDSWICLLPMRRGVPWATFIKNNYLLHRCSH
jgi:hypothetical protein